MRRKCNMAIIYKVSNDINDKVYIGKTIKTIEERWWQHTNSHINDGTHFHRAILQYGKEHFRIEIIEDNVKEDELDQREKYWIAYFNSYENGYNSTLGGDGMLLFPKEKVLEMYYKNKMNKQKTLDELGCSKQVLNRILKEENLPTLQKGNYSYQELAEKYLELKNVNATAEFFQCGRQPVLEAIKQFKIDTKHTRAVYQIDKNTGEILNTFSSIREAARIVFNDIEKSKNINSVCQGKGKTAYGYKWAYVDNNC